MKKTIFAGNYTFEIIGEAAKCIPEDVRKEYILVPWRKMAGIRNVIVYAYFGINLNVV